MKSLWENIFRDKNQTEESISAILKKIPIFQELKDKELEAVERILHRRFYKQEEIVFRQGDAGVGMYIIEKGRVKIRLEPAGQIVAHLKEGEFFGELALLDDSPRSATAIAESDCKMLGFFQPDLFGLIDRNPRLGVKIVSMLAKSIGDRLKAANEENQEMRNQLMLLQESEGQPVK
ncbi:MAG: cyclic nucleotide-binding domain-containing protein [Calditrichia bacterium]